MKKGDILAQIDPVPFQNALAQAQASYQNAVANVANLEAQIGTSHGQRGDDESQRCQGACDNH